MRTLATFGLALNTIFFLHQPSQAEVSQKFVDTGRGYSLAAYYRSARAPELELVFVHGTPGDASAFQKQFQEPFPRARLIAIDRPGFGASGGARIDPSLDHQVRALEALIDRDPGIPRILIGHSYGGAVVTKAAVERIGRIDGLLLIATALDPRLEDASESPSFTGYLSEREMFRLRADLRDLERKLGELNIPTVVLQGAEDPVVSVAHMSYLRARMGQAGHLRHFHPQLYPGFNHFIPWEQPQAVHRALGFLREKVLNPSARSHRRPR